MIPFKHTRNGALTIKGDVIILNANTATKSDYPLILKIWEASVKKLTTFERIRFTFLQGNHSTGFGFSKFNRLEKSKS